MTLETNIAALAKAIGTDVGALQKAVAQLQAGGGNSGTFTKSIQSSEINVAAGAYTEVQHGFGEMPKFVSLTLICKVTDAFGYEVGEEVSLDQVYTGISFGTDVGIQSSSTSSKIRIKVAGAGAGLTNINTGQPGIVDPNNYKLIVRAWA